MAGRIGVGRRLRSSLFSTAATAATSSFRASETASALSSVLQHHIQSTFPSRGRYIHAHILKTGLRPNTNVRIKLLILHLKSDASLRDARKLFDEIPEPTLSAYSYMVCGYFRRGQVDETLELVSRVRFSDEKPYWFIMSMLLKHSATSKSLGVGKQVHARIMKSVQEFDEVLFTALIDSYAKNGKLDYARRVYERLPVGNFVCSTALITGYMNRGSAEAAEKIFQSTAEKDVVVFNAMLEGYSQRIETCEKALAIYKDMQLVNFRPTVSTFASVIGACSSLSALEIGQQVHCQLIKTTAFFHVKTTSALVDMYCKCGRIEDARRVFNHMPERNVVSWTSMIDGYGKNGSSHEALRLFYEMRKDLSVKPNHVTFLGALSACGHAGLVADGKEIFNSMERDFSINPRMEHYACVVDLLGRAGCLTEAFDFVKQMPQKPNSDVWAALLAACRLHGDVKIAAIAAKEVFELSQTKRPGAYVALSNTFAAAGKWRSVCDVREFMKEKGVSKDTGCSW